MNIGKWNYETREYDPYTPPEGNVVLYSWDMDEAIVCTGCGKDMKFGKSYTSMELHTPMGMGYPVCVKCYELEWKRRRDSDSGRM